MKEAWVERQRVVPTQRWPSYFGERFTLLPDRLLVVQPGYGEQRPTGAVFDLPLGACPKIQQRRDLVVGAIAWRGIYSGADPADTVWTGRTP